MNEVYTVEELNRACRNEEALAEYILHKIQMSDVVTLGNEQLDSTHVMLEMIEENSDLVNAMLSSLSQLRPVSPAYMKALQEKQEEMSAKMASDYYEEVGRSVKGINPSDPYYG